MTLYAPRYYKDFVCIADKCRHSCCVGWEIDVDHDALSRYATLGTSEGDAILRSIDREGTPHFRLTAEERCPHLDERGLCRIISSLGEGYLCDICREHPRFYNDLPHGREVGIGMVCEEACRLILTAPDHVLVENGRVKGRARKADFDALAYREGILALLWDESIPYTERLARIACAHDICLTVADDDEYRALLSSLEYMHEANRTRFAAFSADIATPKVIEPWVLRALSYFVYRHVSAAKNEEDARCALGFALFCERLLASLAKKEGGLALPDFCTLARTVSEELEYSEENTESIAFSFF